MLYGVKINGIDTLTQYGLCMLADYTIQTPPLRENRVVIPGVDGSVDLSQAITGRPEYGDRQVKFTLFKGVNDMELDNLKRQMTALYHGQKVTVELPFDSAHVFSGTLQFGDAEGYNTGEIPVVMTASPWRDKKSVTTVSRDDLSTSYKVLTLNNESRPVVPSIVCTKATTIQFGTKTYSVSANTTYKNLDIVLAPGTNQLQAKVSSGTGQITVTYQEGCL